MDKHRSHNPDMDGWYDVEEDVCYGCAAVETHVANKDVKGSTKLYVRDTGPTQLREIPAAG